MRWLKTVFEWVIIAIGAMFIIALIGLLAWWDKVRFVL